MQDSVQLEISNEFVAYWQDPSWLKLVFPHHAFNRAIRLAAVLGISFLIVFGFYFPFNREIDQLPDWHSVVYFDRLFH